MKVLEKPEGQPIGQFYSGPTCIYFDIEKGDISIARIREEAIPAVILYAQKERLDANAVMLGGYWMNLPEEEQDRFIRIFMAIQLYYI